MFFLKKKSPAHFFFTKCENLVLVTSTLRVSQKPLSYSKTRSIFSFEERLAQTIETISSIKNKIKSCSIVLLENSDLSQDEQKKIEALVDYFVSFSSDKQATNLRDSLHKGAGEIYMLQSFMKIAAHINYKRLFKISGRYQLNKKFDLNRFPTDKFGFLFREINHSTRLYSSPKCLESQYLHQLDLALQQSQLGKSIEDYILKGVKKEHIQLIPELGLSGIVAVGGDEIHE